MNTTEKLDSMLKREFFALGRPTKSLNLEMRMMLLELGFSAEDDGSMAAFREEWGKSLIRRNAKIRKEEQERLNRQKKAVEEVFRRYGGKIEIVGEHKNVSVEDRYLVFTCPDCSDTQRIDLTKSGAERRSPPLDERVAIMAQGESGIISMAKARAAGAPRAHPMHGIPTVSLPPAGVSPPIVRLAQGWTITYVFECRKCRFRQGEFDIRVSGLAR